MGREIERKFLVRNDGYRSGPEGILYRQGYLSSHRERVVRIRVCGQKGYLTVKGTNTGAARSEFEYEIPFEDAVEMLDNLCEKPLIEKLRYKVKHKGWVWEVDEFLGENEGLVIAEIELLDEDEEYLAPEWVGEEVTGDVRYFNSSLIKNPYKNWHNKK